MKPFGIGRTMAGLMDATLARATLVHAFLRLDVGDVDATGDRGLEKVPS